MISEKAIETMMAPIQRIKAAQRKLDDTIGSVCNLIEAMNEGTTPSKGLPKITTSKSEKPEKVTKQDKLDKGDKVDKPEKPEKKKRRVKVTDERIEHEIQRQIPISKRNAPTPSTTSIPAEEEKPMKGPRGPTRRNGRVQLPSRTPPRTL